MVAAMSPGLPRLLEGGRRRLFAVLLSTGVGQAVLAGATAVAMPLLLDPSAGVRTRVTATGALVAAALLLGLVRLLERRFAERLGQHYVHQMRSGLVASSLQSVRGPSVGITVARTTNDLSAIRNWVALGITPIAVGIPVIVGTTVVLAMLHPLLVIAVLGPMALLVVVLAALAGPAFRRARILRRRRGSLASHVADTVAAAPSIRTAGGVRRELAHVDRLGAKVAAAAVRRATVAGSMRGAAVAAATLSMVAVAAVGAWQSIDAATVATALTVVGVLSGPVTDLGRVAEYRQSYQAARRILAPALAQAAETEQEDRRRSRLAGGQTPAPARRQGSARSVHVTSLSFGDVCAPGLVATPGARVVLRSDHPERINAVVNLLTGSPTDARGWVRVAGCSLSELPMSRRRLFVGYAARAAALERGTIARAVRYRDPGSAEPAAQALRAVGLHRRVAALPEGERTRLRRGGEPLSAPERARLQVARALYAEPPLVVLDHIDEHLGADGRRMLAELLHDYPGVVVLATDAVDSLVPDHQVWDLDGGDRAGTAHLPAVLAER